MRFRQLVIAVFGLLFSFYATAQSVHTSGAVAVTRAANVTTLTGATETEFQALLNRPSGVTTFNNLLNRAYIPAGNNGIGVISASERYAISMAGGTEMEALLTRGIAAAEIAKGAAAVAASVWAGATIADRVSAPISKWLGHDNLDIGDMRCTATNSGWQCDAMETPPAPAPAQGWCTSGDCRNTFSVSSHGSLQLSARASGYTGQIWYIEDAADSVRGYATSNGQASGINYSWYGTAQYPFTGSSAESCPATTDALNPSWSRPAGSPPVTDPSNPTGPSKCPTGRYSTPNDADLLKRIGGQVARLGVPELLNLFKNVVDPGVGAGTVPVADPGTLSGPATGPQTTTTTTTPDPAGGTPVTTTTSSGNSYTYNGPTVTTINTTTVNNGGTTTTTTTTPPPPEQKNCGLPSTPPCKIDENGTPTYVAPSDKPITKLIGDDADKTAAVAGSIVDPGFGWFDAPPVAECTPFAWQTATYAFVGSTSGIIDPCPTMVTLRTLMGYFWALFAAFFCFGMVYKTINGKA